VHLKRREFLKLAGATAGVAVATGGLRKASAENLPPPIPKPGDIREYETVYSICENCLWRCGIQVKVAGGRVLSVNGYAENPKSRGMLCARGLGSVAQRYDADRLKRPLIRIEGSKRGEGRYREASWEEALDKVAEGFLKIKAEHGPEAVAWFGHGSGDSWFVDYLPAAWGSPNAAKPSVSLCTAPRETAAMWTFGRAIGGHEPIDWENTRYIVLVGHHIGEDTHNTQLQEFTAALKRGAKLVVVDPRQSMAASKADHWLPIKPGTDTALLLAWLHVLIAENRYDREYVEKYTVGFDQLAEHVKTFTPEWAAAITEIPAPLIRQIAREMADNAPRAVLPPTRHAVWYGNDTQRMRALYLVNVLLGNYGREGGFYLAVPPYLEKYPHPPLVLESSAGGCAGPAGSGEVPEGYRPRADQDKFFSSSTAIQELVEPMITGKPYPIRGLVAYGVSLFHCIPNVPRTKKAIENLDFYVAIDVQPQEHVMWADVILPEAVSLERHDDLVTVAHKTPFIHARFPAVEPLWDTKPGWWIAKQLGERLGLGQYFPWHDIEEYLNGRLMSLGLDVGFMKQVGTMVQNGRPWLEDWESSGLNPFATPSGKIEIYSQTFADAGFDPLPAYEPPNNVPAGQYRLLYGRSPVHTFSRTQNNWILMELDPENEVWINPAEARALGVTNGAYVWLENDDGVREGPVKAKVTERIRRDCVYIVHGFGHKTPGMRLANGRGASDNYLQTRYKLDPISGGAGLRINTVRVIPGAPDPRHPSIRSQLSGVAI
jgi:thiosulfate reductase/polysulfide reductase chain A